MKYLLILLALLVCGCSAHKPVAKRDLHPPAPYCDKDSRFFPPWGFVPAAFIGICGISWGLTHEHSPRRRLAAIAFVFGCILWMYGFAGIVIWSTKF